MAQDIYEIKKELVVFLRNSDIISTTNRGVTTSTDTGTFAGANNHTLAVNPTLAKNVRSITVASSPLTRYADYTVNYATGVITFTSAQTGAYTIQYDQGSSDSIYPDFPQKNLKLSAFPRIAVEIIGGDINDVDLGATITHHTYNITIVCYAIQTEILDSDILEDLCSSVISNMLSNKKLFYYLKYVQPGPLGPVINFPPGQDKVLSRSVDFNTIFNYE